MSEQRSGIDETTTCHICGANLNDPKNRGDPDEDGVWVCSKFDCRYMHDKGLLGVPEYVE